MTYSEFGLLLRVTVLELMMGKAKLMEVLKDKN